MFDKLKKLLASAFASDPDEPESVDHPRPRRANANPPQRDWFARVRERSSHEPALSVEDQHEADSAIARAMQGARK